MKDPSEKFTKEDGVEGPPVYGFHNPSLLRRSIFVCIALIISSNVFDFNDDAITNASKDAGNVLSLIHI